MLAERELKSITWKRVLKKNQLKTKNRTGECVFCVCGKEVKETKKQKKNDNLDLDRELNRI